MCIRDRCKRLIGKAFSYEICLANSSCSARAIQFSIYATSFHRLSVPAAPGSHTLLSARLSHVFPDVYKRQVPESTRCRDLFRQFQQKKVQIAIVVDEYGGTSGMVTMEDLLESIVGEIQDEYDEEEDTVTQVSESVYTIDGAADLEEVQRFLPLEVPEEADYDTCLLYTSWEGMGKAQIPAAGWVSAFLSAALSLRPTAGQFRRKTGPGAVHSLPLLCL